MSDTLCFDLDRPCCSVFSPAYVIIRSVWTDSPMTHVGIAGGFGVQELHRQLTHRSLTNDLMFSTVKSQMLFFLIKSTALLFETHKERNFVYAR